MNKAERMIGMCAKAGQLASGAFAVDKAIKTNKARLVIIAQDASDETKKSLTDACSYYHTPSLVYGTKEGLGHMTGKEYRACIAILNESFAKSIEAAIAL